MKNICSLLLILLFTSCQEPIETDLSEKIEEKTSTEDSIQKVMDIKSNEFPIRIDRNQTRKLNVSTYQVAKEIRNLIFNNTDSLTMEELFDEKITFRNNKGKMISIPLRSLIDSTQSS